MSEAQRSAGATDPKTAFAELSELFENLVAERRQMQGRQLPEELKQRIIGIRRTLLLNGLSPQQIDATPGLEPTGL